MKRFLFILLVLFVSACTTTGGNFVDNEPIIENPTEPSEPVVSRIPLYWENTTEEHSERIPWSDAINKLNKESMAIYASAEDINSFCPKFHSLDIDRKTKAIGELFVATTYYESAFKPETLYRECNKTKCQYSSGCQYNSTYGYCMKGGHALDGGIVISRGLLQISLQSAQGYGCQVKTPNDLHNPIKNLECGVIIMKRLITNRGSISTKNNYWAVLKSGGGYNKLPEIKSRVKKYAPFCY